MLQWRRRQAGVLEGSNMNEHILDPSPGWIKPYPFCELNHLTVPSDIGSFSLQSHCADWNALDVGSPMGDEGCIRQDTIDPR
jgi:hypothetical protein